MAWKNGFFKNNDMLIVTKGLTMIYRSRLKIPIDWDIEMYYTPPSPP